MTTLHGKKIGEIRVQLTRQKTGDDRTNIVVDLHFDIESGRFWTEYQGTWYSAFTQYDLIEKLQSGARALEWQRYLVVDYAAEAMPIEGTSGRPASAGGRILRLRGRESDPTADEPLVICVIRLRWWLCDISAPFALPQRPEQRVRARRSVDGEAKGNEIVDDNDDLPPGAVLWTPERERVLEDALAAIGCLDAQLVALLSGDAAQLAEKLDAAAWLTAPVTGEAP